MIPVNLAIIGARDGGRWHCMLRGLIYGAGIALTYGIASLLCLNGGEDKPYDRYLELYLRALPRAVSQPYHRSDVLFGEGAV